MEFSFSGGVTSPDCVLYQSHYCIRKEEQDGIITIYKNNNTKHHDPNKKLPWTYSLPDHMSIKYDGEGTCKIFQVGKGSACPSVGDFQSVHAVQYDLLLQDGKDNA